MIQGNSQLIIFQSPSHTIATRPQGPNLILWPITVTGENNAGRTVRDGQRRSRSASVCFGFVQKKNFIPKITRGSISFIKFQNGRLDLKL